MAEKILIVEDEPEMLQFLSRFLSRRGYDVDTAESGEEAWRSIEEVMYDLIISDLALEDLTGLELLERVRAMDSSLPFIIITGVGTIESAVEAIKRGAYQYITKPFKQQDFEILTKRALEFGALHRKVDTMQHRQDSEDRTPQMVVGTSRCMFDLLRRVEKVSDSMASVMIAGETGTGKSLLAKQIHLGSSRRDKPFLTIDCGALTETLLESELFGHVKGAFTGAVRAKRGLLEDAQGGTIFLDEICEIKAPTQVKLLRAIQEREIKPVGGNKTVMIDVRFISATSRDIKEEVERGFFREELYYRLAVVPLFLPPLRERKEDIPLLIDHFLNIFCRLYRKKVQKINPDVLQMLLDHSWKGNIRELANIMERGVLLSEEGVLTLDCLCTEFGFHRAGNARNAGAVLLKEAVEIAERSAIESALSHTNNNRSEAARVLGISRRALYDKMAQYQIQE